MMITNRAFYTRKATRCLY